MNDVYEYEFIYRNGNEEVKIKSPADIDEEDMQDILKRFLKACSWTEEQVESIINHNQDE